MKKWDVQYWAGSLGKGSVKDWLYNQLTKEQLKSVSKELIMLEFAGNEAYILFTSAPLSCATHLT